jgi:hypothetical protein
MVAGLSTGREFYVISIEFSVQSEEKFKTSAQSLSGLVKSGLTVLQGLKPESF